MNNKPKPTMIFRTTSSFTSLRITLLCFIALLQISATQINKGITLNEKNAPLKEVFQKIKSQSGHAFVFNDEDVEKAPPVNIKIDNANIEMVLVVCLKGTQLDFELKEKVVIIKQKKATAPQKQSSFVVTGRVTDEKGFPVPGVNIVSSGILKGTATNAEGLYKITLNNGEGSLIYSFIGYKPQTINIKGRTELDVQLEVEMNEITDVVVTGYGKRSKESYTGAVSSYSGEELRTVSTGNVLSTLQAVDPSFVMVENDELGSNPNEMPTFEIRGSASIPGIKDEYSSSPNMPTFVLDGFEVQPAIIFDLDPNRVESITILKDASATAIYGSAGANGVVVIKTKTPKAGKLNITYNYKFDISAPDLTDYDLLNASEKLQLEVEAGYFSWREGTTIQNIEAIKMEYNRKREFVEKGYDTYWLAKPLQTAIGHKHSLMINGGSPTFRYGITTRFENNDGVMKGSGRDRKGLSISLQYILNDFTFMNVTSYDNILSLKSPYGSFGTYARLNPYFRDRDDEGRPIYEFDRINQSRSFNPLFNATLNVIDEDKAFNFSNNFSVDYQVTESSIIRGSFMIAQTNKHTDNYKPANHTSFANYSAENYSRRGKYTAGVSEGNSFQGKLMYTFSKTLQDHLLYFNVGSNIQEQSTNAYSVTAEGFSNEKLNAIYFAQRYGTGRPSGSEYTSRLLGFLGVFNYTFDNRYLFDASYRVDGSSRFGANSRWAPFWSLGSGWNIHNEDFLNTNDLVQRLKLRGSYGLTGSQNFNPYQALTTYSYFEDDRYHFASGASMMAMGNEELKWQTTVQANVGIEATLFKSRLTLNANVYNKLSKDVLTPVTLAPSLGFQTYMENLGEIENKGYEFRSTVFIIKQSDVNWSVNFSGIHNKNQLKKLSNNLKSINDQNDEILDGDGTDNFGNDIVQNRPVVRYIEGQSANTIWAVRSLGIDPSTGKEIFLTKDGDQTSIWNSRDQVPVGTSDPMLRGNFGTRIKYKNLEMRAIFRYSHGGKKYNSTLVGRVENANKRENVDRRVFEERWKKPGDITFFKNVSDHTPTKPTSRFVEDFSFINMESLSINYYLNNDYLQKIKIKQIQLSAFLNDVFRVSTIKMERGLNYPFAHTVSGSVRVRF